MSPECFQNIIAAAAPSVHIRLQRITGRLRATLVLLLLLAATAASSSAQIFKTVYSFCPTCVDGGNPLSMTLVQGKNGDLYGTTYDGGAFGAGTIFEVTTEGKLTTLYSFSCLAGTCRGGIDSNGGLVLAADGSFYGVTDEGGAIGYGTVFKMTPAGKLTTLHSFGGTDGAYPQSGLIQATDGNFYGTTFGGGANSSGTVFKITASGVFESLHSFCADSCSDGAGPNGLIQAADGNFYGTTYSGGGIGSDSPCYPLSGGGTSFQLTPSGALTTLAAFCQPNGFSPSSALVQGANGDFYGTTFFGGDGVDETGYGTVYEMTPTGSLTSLYSFCLQTGCADGIEPQSLTRGTDGNFYGTTAETLFKITPAGQLATLHTFPEGGGGGASGGLMLDTNGAFYGATYEGGKYGVGSVFSLDTRLGAFVKTVPTSGAAGTKVTIMGTNLTEATSVSFDGTSAMFEVVAGSEITATVPTGATTGAVYVTTSTGTLKSNAIFQILQ